MPEKVPDDESKAGPGCWQCARCGWINSNDREECADCRDDPVTATTEQATLVDSDAQEGDDGA